MLRTDKVKGHLVSVKLGADTLNGDLVGLGTMLADGEAYNSAAIAAGVQVVLIDPVAIDYVNELLQADYTALAGTVVRGRVLEAGNIITIKQAQITGFVGVGDVVEVSAANGWEVGPTTAIGTLKAVVDATETIEGLACAVIRIIEA